jgi:hypothetical protein
MPQEAALVRPADAARSSGFEKLTESVAGGGGSSDSGDGRGQAVAVGGDGVGDDREPCSRHHGVPVASGWSWFAAQTAAGIAVDIGVHVEEVDALSGQRVGLDQSFHVRV